MVFSSVPVAANDDDKNSIIKSEETARKEIVSDSRNNLFTDAKGNLKFVNVVVRNPCVIFFFTIALCIGIVIALTSIVFENGNPFTSDETTFDLYDRRSIAYDSLRLASTEIRGIRAQSTSKQAEEVNTPIRTQETLGDMTYWIYESKTENGLFSKEALSTMRSTEIMLTRQKKYPQYCLLEYTEDVIRNETISKCRKELSVLNIFYASSWNSTLAQSIIDELTADKIGLYNNVAACVEYKMLCQFIPPAISTKDMEWAMSIHQRIMTMMIQWDGEGALNDNTEEVSLFLAHMNQLVTKSPFINFFFDANFTINNPIPMYSRSIIYWGFPLSNANQKVSSSDLLKQFIVDTFLDKMKEVTDVDHSASVTTYYFMGTLIFDVIIDILISDALRAILSFILVFVYLRVMIGSWFLAFVGMLEIFLSLPLAWFFFTAVFGIKYFSTLNVLCLFIVAAIGADDIFVFMDAYKQSAHKSKDILGSLESRMSWVYRRSGKAMAITSATTCFAFLCTIISPIASTRSFGIFAALVILFDYILVMTLFCTSVVIYHDRLEEEPGWCCICFCCTKNEPSPTQIALSQNKNEGHPKQDRITYLFQEKIASLIINPRVRGFLVFPLLIWLGGATWYSTKLEATKTTEQALSPDHPLQKGVTILSEKFPKVQQDRGTDIHFVWGLENVNRDGVKQLLDPEFVGVPTYIDNFNFQEKCLNQMINACDRLKTEESFEGQIKRKKNGLRAIKCFADEYGAFHALGGLDNCSAVTGDAWKMSDWKMNQSGNLMEDFLSSKSCYGDGSIEDIYSQTLGWDGDSLRFVGISIESSILDPYSTLPENIVRDHYEALIDFKRELDSKMIEECQSQVIMTDLDQKFVFMNNQRIYKQSTFSGSIIGVAIAFLVLLVSTRKFHISLFATMCICSVLVSVLGSITLLGWTLGTNEAILISILAGFSVDYVVHLAHAYVHASGDTTKRIKESFGDMGISVFSGMLTSVVASIPLFMCTLTFFAKFGTFLCLTIVFSWTFANIGFMSLLATAQIPINNNIKKG